MPDIEVLAFRSNDYSRNTGVVSDWKALLLTNVVVGQGMKLTADNTSLTAPPPGYDSVSIFEVFLNLRPDHESGSRRWWKSELR